MFKNREAEDIKKGNFLGFLKRFGAPSKTLHLFKGFLTGKVRFSVLIHHFKRVLSLKKILRSIKGFIGDAGFGTISRMIKKALPSKFFSGAEEILEPQKKNKTKFLTSFLVALLIVCLFFMAYTAMKVRGLSKKIEEVIGETTPVEPSIYEGSTDDEMLVEAKTEKIVWKYGKKKKMPWAIGFLAAVGFFVSTSIGHLKRGETEEFKNVAINAASIIGLIVAAYSIPKLLKGMKRNWHNIKV